MYHLINKYWGKIVRFFPRQKRRLIHMYLCAKAKSVPYVTLKQMQKIEPTTVTLLEVHQEQLHYAEPSYSYVEQNPLMSGSMGSWKKAVISNAICFANSDVVIINNTGVLHDLHENEDWIGHVKFEDEVILKDNNQTCKLAQMKQAIFIDEAIKVGGTFGFNYYHFVFQLLSKMQYIDKVNSKVPLLLDYSARDIKSMRTMVDWLNKNNHPIIYMEYDVAYNVKKLHYVTSPNRVVPNVKKNPPKIEAEFSISNILYLRKGLLKHLEQREHLLPKRVFLARRNTTKRRSYNEFECFVRLQSLGFEEIYPEKLTLKEQMELFYNAEIIVGATGAAFTNTLFASEKTKIVVLSNYKMKYSFFSSIAAIVGCQMTYLFDKNLGIPNHLTSAMEHQSFHIDVEELEKLISDLI